MVDRELRLVTGAKGVRHEACDENLLVVLVAAHEEEILAPNGEGVLQDLRDGDDHLRHIVKKAR